jgi:hypothetical protein
LDTRTNNENDYSNNHVHLSPKLISERTINQRSKPSGLSSHQLYTGTIFGVELTQQNSRYPPPFEASIRVYFRELGAKGLHGQHTGDYALVIAEEETTQ